MRIRLTVIFTFLLVTRLGFAQAGLVTTEWLAEHSKDDGIVLIDMSDSLQYQRFHLPNAINLPYELLVQDKKRVSLSIDQGVLIKLLGQLGISRDSYVIAYDDTGGLHASRLLWELTQLNHPRMALLDGGLVKWIREGRPVSAQAPTVKTTTYTATKTHRNETATLTDVAPNSRDKNTLLLDVRSEQEYVGHPKQPRSGHIPGAKWWEWDQALDIDGGFTLQNKTKLTTGLSKLGLKDKSQPVIVYCRSGHRAAHAYFTLKNLGFENVRLYDGSMKEYERQKAQPLVRGKQP